MGSEENTIDPEIEKLLKSKDREAQMVARPNRATRRRRPPADPWYTKATHRFKKIRKEHAKRAEKREGAAARARKASEKSNTKVS